VTLDPVLIATTVDAPDEDAASDAARRPADRQAALDGLGGGAVRDFLIPASTGPGDRVRGLLDGWMGPCSAGARSWAYLGKSEGVHDLARVGGPPEYPQIFESFDLPPQMDTRRPEVRDRIVRFLARGERCLCPAPDSGDGGAGCSAGRVTGAPEYVCSACSGTCWRRPPYDLRWVTEAELSGRLTDWKAAAVIWCSVERVRAGLRPVLGWVGESREDERHGPLRAVSGPNIPGMLHNDFGGRWMRVTDDDAVLAEGFALLDSDGAITVPRPDGPVRLEAPHAT